MLGRLEDDELNGLFNSLAVSLVGIKNAFGNFDNESKRFSYRFLQSFDNKINELLSSDEEILQAKGLITGDKKREILSDSNLDNIAIIRQGPEDIDDHVHGTSRWIQYRFGMINEANIDEGGCRMNVEVSYGDSTEVVDEVMIRAILSSNNNLLRKCLGYIQ